MKVTKRIAVLMASALMVASFGLFVGCSSDAANEEFIRTSIEQELDPYKNQDSSVISEIQTQNAATFALIGVDGAQYASAVLDGFDYSIEDVSVDGDNATVTLVMTQKAIDSDEATNIMNELAADSSFASMSQSEKQAEVSKRLLEYINSVEATPQDPVTIDLVLNGNTWEPTEESATKLQNLISF